MPNFKETLSVSVAKTEEWKEQLIKDQKKMVNQEKRDQLQGYIDILTFWINLGTHVKKYMP